MKTRYEPKPEFSGLVAALVPGTLGDTENLATVDGLAIKRVMKPSPKQEHEEKRYPVHIPVWEL